MASTGEPFGLFWNSDNGDRTYDANSFEYWLKKFFTSGVFNGDLQVQATSGMTVKVGTGYTNVDGKVKFWNAEFNLTLNPANSTYPRIDTIVITRDNVNREIRCEVVTGGYSGDTPQPTAPVRNPEIYQLVLAQIHVGAGATGITQAEITDTRPDTSLCGWITGTVTELDFEQFTVQFESYFAQFKRQHENEWSVWELTQKAAYAAWLSEVKAQQIQDKADWDAWYAALQEELHELPADTAEYLQIEIDEIKESGTTGSILHITTTNSELEGKTVTVSCGTETRTGTFDSNLECTIAGFKSVGTLTIVSTDGIQTAVKTVDIDYYSKYEIAIAFWAATVNIQGDDNLKGVDVVVKDSNDTTITTITLNAVTGQGVFEAQKADTYTFNYTVNGTAYSVPLAVTEETTYELSLTAGFDYKQWVTLGGLDPTDYTDLEDVFADEAAVRRLMTIHASADYLIEKVTDDIDTIDDFTANDTAMKWIGLRDYVCDGLTAIAGVEAKFMASQYWDRYLKDHVPAMTSNTAPYGTVVPTSNNTTYPAWHMFDGDDSTIGAMASSSISADSTTRVYYLFTNPICIKKALIMPSMNCTGKIQYSDDGSTWTDATDIENFVAQQSSEISINNDGYHLYWAFLANSWQQASVRNLAKIQFYGRSLNVSVPVMTSNTAPYGEANASSVQSGSYAYKAFNGDAITVQGWASTEQTNAWVAYDFGKKVKIKMVNIAPFCQSDGGGLRAKDFILQGYDGNGWVDIYEDTIPNASQVTNNYYSFANSTEYSKYRLYVKNNYATNNGYVIINELQFYGVDYSEREFAEGSTMKYLYDHGVELETFIAQKGSSTTSVSPSWNGEELYFPLLVGTNNNRNNFSFYETSYDLTNFDLLRATFGFDFKLCFSIAIFSSAQSSGTYGTNEANISPTSITSPNTDLALDISAINQTKYIDVGVMYVNGRSGSIKELWLE